MFDPSKVTNHIVRNCDIGFPGRGQTTQTVTRTDFDACAAALAEAVAQRDEERRSELTQAQADGEALAGQRDAAVRVVKEYRALHPMCSIRVAGLINATQIDDRCPTCKAADVVLGGK